MLTGIDFYKVCLDFFSKILAAHTSLTIQKLISSKFEITGYEVCYIWFVNMK